MDEPQDVPPAEPDHDSSDGDETVTASADAAGDSLVMRLLEEERQNVRPMGMEHGSVAGRVRDLQDSDEEQGSVAGSSVDGLPRGPGSPLESLPSAAGDSPSVQGSLVSSPSSSILPSVASRPGLNSPTPSFRPFDRRFQSRISSSNIHLTSSRPSSPAFLSSHSRNASLTSQFLLDRAPSSIGGGDTETPNPPWEVVRWTRLKKLNGQAFSEAGKRNFGAPTCMVVGQAIVLGTSKGVILVFDFNQNLKTIVGMGTKAVEAGGVTSIALSADYSTVAAGHASGSIFTWDMGRASRPFLSIPHLDEGQLQHRTEVGHMPGAAVTHLSFLGSRRTALVSADDKGMAFSHLATRGTGALGRTVKTVRILGRYPDAPLPPGKVSKPSTVLASASLPLGNVERATDMMGLTAMLTPWILVIVSTTPVAETQHRSSRPRDVTAHSTLTGCLAWFPAVRPRSADANNTQLSRPKLVYCWSNVLTVLDVDEKPSDDKDRLPELKFKARSRWKCEEPIVAVQWLSRSVLAVLTITQRLIVLEDRSMRMTDAFDLLSRHIYHTDLFSKHLRTLVEQLDEADTSMHGVVADAFYMSFKAYKGKIFLLGFNDVSIGALTNWHERLVALMESGDYVGAIQLATSYYTGDADRLTVGLPEDVQLRHTLVREKLLEIMTASLKFVFGQRQKNPEAAPDEKLQDLAETCVVACQSIDNVDFLFDEVYEWFEDGGVPGILLETTEPFILEKSIDMMPPAVVKTMVSHYVAKGWGERLEEMICHMQTATLDLDQITQLCKQHSLYDALIYVWNQAIGDYITPLMDLLSLVVPLMQNGDHEADAALEDERCSVNAVKTFPYLSHILTGRVYPLGDPMDEEAASNAKAELYWFLFSGKTITWPAASGRTFLTRRGQGPEPSFPYLRLILKYDAPSFLSALNEAFEDPFLNDSPEKQANGGAKGELPEERIFGMTVNRQYIVSILLEIMNPADFAPADTVYLDMFIARNMPKFPQYLLFPGSTLTRVLEGLCNYPGSDLAEDAQLSAEYLLSAYHPSDSTSLIPQFRKAGFFRILKRIYRSEKQYGRLIETYFEDPEDREAVFGSIGDCLRPQRGLNARQVQTVLGVIRAHARDLLDIDPEMTATTLVAQPAELHRQVLDAAPDIPYAQYSYLNTLLEKGDHEARRAPDRDLVERYLRLMCTFDPGRVSEYVGVVQSANLRLEELLPTMENQGVIDAAVVLMAREGQIKEAMDRLVKHLGTLEAAMKGILSGAEAPESGDVQDGAEETLKALQKYVHVGIWLCQSQTKPPRRVVAIAKKKKKTEGEALSPDETLWLTLIDAAVQTTRSLSAAISAAVRATGSGSGSQSQSRGADVQDGPAAVDEESLVKLLRSLVQHTFTSLLTATSTPATTHPGSPTSAPSPPTRIMSAASATTSNLSFLRILRAFLSRAAASSPNLADLRSVLQSIFAAYAYEESILRLSNRLLERSLFVSVDQAVELRQRGWRPKGSTCEACAGRVWGPGVAGNVFEKWEEKRAEEERKRKTTGGKVSREAGEGESTGKGKGKGKAKDKSVDIANGRGAGGENGTTTEGAQDGDGPKKEREQSLGRLVVFACKHIYHESCLSALQASGTNGLGLSRLGERTTEYRCPIDG